MNNKFVFLLLLSFIFVSKPVKSGSLTNVIGTGIALGAGVGAYNYSKHLFYKNPDAPETVRTARDWTRELAYLIKQCFYSINDKKRAATTPGHDEMKNFVIGFRLTTAILTGILVKSLC